MHGKGGTIPFMHISARGPSSHHDGEGPSPRPLIPREGKHGPIGRHCSSGSSVHCTRGPLSKRQKQHFSKPFCTEPVPSTDKEKFQTAATLGDASPEARAHGMSVELNVATTEYLGDSFTFIDCPGSIEFLQEQAAALSGIDAAVVVCEPDDKKVPALQLILKQLEELNIPRFLFPQQDRQVGRQHPRRA